MESDFCLLEIYAEAIKVISSIVLIIGIIFSVVTFIEFGFFYGLMELIGIIVIAIQGFLSSIFIRFLLELKKEGNQTTQFTYVNAKLLQEVLDTLKSIENKDNKWSEVWGSKYSYFKILLIRIQPRLGELLIFIKKDLINSVTIGILIITNPPATMKVTNYIFPNKHNKAWIG